ncbi:hypothetical protein RF11_02047 [Thelohanellus kitauei]|uniref:Uncharacterized protein n=1 Tax=Thelohanellus kitauei TaxID=669202 RepID=A0A0C2MGV7_THEKT|nr:hypothetical protein RF11_02047 [Thelohanellus kitauei]
MVSADGQEPTLKPFTMSIDPELWLVKFDLVAESCAWDLLQRSKKMALFFDDEVLSKYTRSPVFSLPPSEKKYAQIKEFVRCPTSSLDSLSLSFREYQNLRLLPGQSVLAFKDKIKALLTRSMPSLLKVEREFMLTQRILESLPPEIASHLRIMRDANLDILCQNADILLQPSSQSRIALIEGQVDENTGNQVDYSKRGGNREASKENPGS